MGGGECGTVVGPPEPCLVERTPKVQTVCRAPSNAPADVQCLPILALTLSHSVVFFYQISYSMNGGIPTIIRKVGKLLFIKIDPIGR